MGRMHDFLRGLDAWLEREDDAAGKDETGAQVARGPSDGLFARELAAAAAICAEPDCEEPVAAPYPRCPGCGLRLCGECLSYHAQDGCADAHAAQWCAVVR